MFKKHPFHNWHAGSYPGGKVDPLQLERGDLPFDPGACVALFCDNTESRTYNIAAGTSEEILRFLIRRVPNDRVSNWLAQRKPGDMVQASAPFSWFRPGLMGKGQC